MSSADSSSWSEKERDLFAELTAVCNANHIKVILNPPHWFYEGATVALDVEHDEAGGFVGCGLLVSGTDTVCYFSDVRLLTNIDFSSLSIVAHNGKTDLECLQMWGCNIKNSQLVHDTELIGHIIDSSLKSYGLKAMSKRDLGIEYPSYDAIVGKRTAKVRRTLDKWPVDIVSLYNALDVYCTMKLYELQRTKGRVPDKLYFEDVEKPASYVFASMETRGVRVDLSYLESLKASLEAQKSPIEAAIKNELGDINLNSPKQLLEALNGKGLFPSLKGKPSTDKRALQTLKGTPLVAQLLGFSELETLLSSFVYPYLERNTEVVHPFFNQCGTRTGRPSCSNPNLLQIPRRTDNGKLVRRMFVPRDGMLMGDSDFGQIEPRVLAHLSKDPVLCEMFNDGVDFHEYTATRLQISRDRAKVLNLSVGYRATFKSVSSQLKCSDQEAQREIDKWWQLFPSLRRWQDKLIYDSKRSGFCTTLLGRRIRVDDLSHGNSWRRESAERQLINNITQGSAAEIMKMAMIRISNNEMLSSSFGLLVQVYDELLFESSDMVNDIKLVESDMVNCIKLEVPLTVDCKTGINWADSH